MKKSRLLISLFIITICLVTINYSQVQATPGAGAIWTTRVDCGDDYQDINHYAKNEWVFINGANFDPGVYSWFIIGKPGNASNNPNVRVAQGNDIEVEDSGSFCFPAYQIHLDDRGEYGVNFDGKKDNYRVLDAVLLPPLR